MESPVTLEDVINFLLETPLFEDLDATQLSEIVHIMQIQRFRDGQTIFEESDDGNAWFVIFDGEAGVSKESLFAPNKTLAVLGPRSCFGEMAILDGSKRSATIAARDDVTVFRFPRIPFNDLLAEGNLAAYKLVHAMARVLCDRQRQMTQQLSSVLEESGAEVPGLRHRIGPLLDAYSVSE